MGEFFSPSQVAVIHGVSNLTSSLSFIGSLFIIVNFLCFKSLRTFAFSLILCLATSDLVSAIAVFMGAPENGSSRCIAQGFFLTFGAVSSILWTGIIAFTIHMVYLRRSAKVKGYRNYYHMFAWTISTLYSILPATTGSYGNSGAWCWIQGDTPVGIFWQFFTTYGVLWVVVFYISVVYLKVWKSERRHKDSSISPRADSYNQEEKRSDFLKRTKYYPFVLIVAYFWGSVNRISQTAHGEHVFWLTLLHRLFANSKGFMNCMLYGWTEEVWYKNKAALTSLYQRFWKDRRPVSLHSPQHDVNVNHEKLESIEFGKDEMNDGSMSVGASSSNVRSATAVVPVVESDDDFSDDEEKQ